MAKRKKKKDISSGIETAAKILLTAAGAATLGYGGIKLYEHVKGEDGGGGGGGGGKGRSGSGKSGGGKLGSLEEHTLNNAHKYATYNLLASSEHADRGELNGKNTIVIKNHEDFKREAGKYGLAANLIEDLISEEHKKWEKEGASGEELVNNLTTKLKDFSNAENLAKYIVDSKKSGDFINRVYETFGDSITGKLKKDKSGKHTLTIGDQSIELDEKLLKDLKLDDNLKKHFKEGVDEVELKGSELKGLLSEVVNRIHKGELDDTKKAILTSITKAHVEHLGLHTAAGKVVNTIHDVYGLGNFHQDYVKQIGDLLKKRGISDRDLYSPYIKQYVLAGVKNIKETGIKIAKGDIKPVAYAGEMHLDHERIVFRKHKRGFGSVPSAYLMKRVKGARKYLKGVEPINPPTTESSEETGGGTGGGTGEEVSEKSTENSKKRKRKRKPLSKKSSEHDIVTEIFRIKTASELNAVLESELEEIKKIAEML